MTDFRSRFIGAALFFAILVVLGTTGYMSVQGWALSDAMYMTVITLTAVGYSEVLPLSQEGRIFTMALLGAGITWMGIWFALLTSFLVELDLTHVMRGRRTSKRIASMENHVIICGAGRTGRQVIHELEHSHVPWVAIERDPGRVDKLLEHYPGGAIIPDDATHDETLLQAGIENARGLISCLSADTDNVFVCLSARELEPGLTIMARAYEEESMDKLYRAGATHVVSPNVSGANRMASMLVRPSVVSFLDIATRSSGLALRMEEIEIREGSWLVGKTLAEARIPQKTRLIVLALMRQADKSEPEFNPGADTEIHAGDELIVLGKMEQIEQLREYLS